MQKELMKQRVPCDIWIPWGGTEEQNHTLLHVKKCAISGLRPLRKSGNHVTDSFFSMEKWWRRCLRLRFLLEATSFFF